MSSPPPPQQAQTSDNPNAKQVTFHGQILQLLGDGTIYWPQEKLLIVSDLHLEKGAALSAAAPLPTFDTKDTLERLKQRLDAIRPQTLICLGDSFHTIERAFLLPPDSLALLHEIARSVNIIWITGNHDSHLPKRLPGEMMQSLRLQNILLCHEADSAMQQATISGHFHPKARIKLRARALSARCFIQNSHHLIMPAFGSYTGGLNICDPALSGFVDKTAIIHLIHDQSTYSVPFQKQRFSKQI